MPAPSGPAMAMPAGTATMAVPGPKVGALRLVSTRHERPMVNKPCKSQINYNDDDDKTDDDNDDD